jgi:hypothetical protein
MSDEKPNEPLEEREYRNMEAATGADRETIKRVLNAARDAGIVFLLPQLRAVGHFLEWTAFAVDSSVWKCAHLMIEGQDRGLCGTPFSYHAKVEIVRGTPLCTGCAAQARVITDKTFDAHRLGLAARAAQPPKMPEIVPTPPAPALPPEPPGKRQHKSSSHAENSESQAAIVAPIESVEDPSEALRLVDTAPVKTISAPKRMPAPAEPAFPSLFDIAS